MALIVKKMKVAVPWKLVFILYLHYSLSAYIINVSFRRSQKIVIVCIIQVNEWVNKRQGIKSKYVKISAILLWVTSLTLKDPFISESCIEIKIKLNFYFHTSLWCLKRFYEGLKGLHKTFWGTKKKCENENLT